MIKADASGKKFVKLALIVIIGLFATHYYITSINKKTTKADIGIVAAASGINAGMPRKEVLNLLSSVELKPDAKSQPVKDPAYRDVLFRISPRGPFAWVRYNAIIEYDRNERLKTAMIIKSNHSDGSDTSCVILSEIPSRNITYPARCPDKIPNL